MSCVLLPVSDPKPVIRFHNLIGGRVQLESLTGEFRLKVRYWTEGCPLCPGDLIRWNPAGNASSIATFQVLTTGAFKGANGVYFAELGRIPADVHVAGETYRAPAIEHLVQLDAPTEDRFIP